jgi:hypothetical protein
MDESAKQLEAAFKALLPLDWQVNVPNWDASDEPLIHANLQTRFMP